MMMRQAAAYASYPMTAVNIKARDILISVSQRVSPGKVGLMRIHPMNSKFIRHFHVVVIDSMDKLYIRLSFIFHGLLLCFLHLLDRFWILQLHHANVTLWHVTSDGFAWGLPYILYTTYSLKLLVVDMAWGIFIEWKRKSRMSIRAL